MEIDESSILLYIKGDQLRLVALVPYLGDCIQYTKGVEYKMNIGEILYTIGFYGIAGVCIAFILTVVHQITVVIYRKIKKGVNDDGDTL